jgi:hypothetical protein
MDDMLDRPARMAGRDLVLIDHKICPGTDVRGAARTSMKQVVGIIILNLYSGRETYPLCSPDLQHR